MNAQIQIIIADDHPIVRQGLRQMIEADQAMSVLAEAGDGAEALRLIETHQPDITLLDVDMPRLDGFAVAQAIRAQGLPVRIIFLTVHREESYLKKALGLGATGYVLKDSAITDIVQAIRQVVAGQHYLSPLLAEYLVSGWQRQADQPASALRQLTPTERLILKLIAEYKTTRDIAETLCVSPHTVETHRKNIAQKLNLRGSHALIKYALTHQDELRQ